MKIFLLLFILFTSLFSTEISYFEDKNAIYTSANINTNKNFLPYTQQNSNFGMTTSTYWLKLIIENTNEFQEEKVINFVYPLLDNVTLFKLRGDTLVQVKQLGNLVKYNSNRPIQPNITFNLLLDAQSQNTYYCKITSAAPMNLDFNLYSHKEFDDYKLIWFASTTFYIGAALVIILYNLVLFFFIRVRAYLYYVLFHSIFLLVILTINGFISQFVYPQNPSIGETTVPITIALAAFLQVLFAYEFLGVQQRGKKTRVLMQFDIIFSVIALFVTIPFPLRASIEIANTASLLGIMLSLMVAIYYWIKYASKSAKYYTVAWLFFILGIAVEHLKNYGFIETNFITLNAMQMGAIVEMVVISIALADRFNDLTSKNRALNNIVITDSLTNIKNRRYFFDRAKGLLASLKRKNENYSLIMMDIDHFKHVNDNFGHDAGDKVLVNFTKNISSYLREEDLFARIGGEEFVLLIRAEKEQSLIFATRLKNSVADLELMSPKGKIKFTVSMGICSFHDANLNIGELLSLADNALYKAKEHGRNRIEIAENI